MRLLGEVLGMACAFYLFGLFGGFVVILLIQIAANLQSERMEK